MKKHLLFIVIFLAACGRSELKLDPVYISSAHMEGANVVPLNVSCGYINEPCVSVTICNPSDPTKCQTVDNILLDTGSYGLRVFASQVSNVGLSPVTIGGHQLAECQNYLDNSADWGPIASAYVTLGGETTSQPITIQMIDSGFPNGTGAGAQSAGCNHPDDSPANAGFNGILGVGPHIQDCGSGCLNPSNFTYFTCTSNGVCANTAVPEGSPGSPLTTFQVSNPVAYMPTDNNGSEVVLPALDTPGAGGANGYFVLGIGTQLNNTAAVPSMVSVIPTNSSTNFTTIFQGHSYTGSFIDSGSNGLFFPQVGTNLPTDASGFYNPTAITPFVAFYNNSTGQHAIAFNILGSAIAFAPYSPNLAFNDVGAEFNGGFDWGLPFFFGKTVYIGIEGKSTNLGTGPYWAY